MTKDEALKLALDKKADNARELGLDYEPENTLHWHALNYRTAPTQNAQAMFEALEKFVEAAIKEALAQPEPDNGKTEPPKEWGEVSREELIKRELEMAKRLAEAEKALAQHDSVQAKPEPEQEPATLEQIRKAMIFGTPLYTTPPQRKPLTRIVPMAQPEPMRLRRGDILRSIETDELCTVWSTSTTGKTLIKWGANDFCGYTAEQIGELFWLEPSPDDLELSAEKSDNYTTPPQRTWVGLTDEEMLEAIKPLYANPFLAHNALEVSRDEYQAIEAKLKERNS